MIEEGEQIEVGLMLPDGVRGRIAEGIHQLIKDEAGAGYPFAALICAKDEGGEDCLHMLTNAGRPAAMSYIVQSAARILQGEGLRELTNREPLSN